MNSAFENLVNNRISGLQNVSSEYGNQIKYITTFSTKAMESLPDEYSKPKVIYPLPYEKAEAICDSPKRIITILKCWIILFIIRDYILICWN